MTKEEMKDKLKGFANENIKGINYSGFNEEKTKVVLIQPFITEVLGYKVLDLEFEENASLTTKAPLRSDITILVDGKSEILIEAKKAGSLNDVKNIEEARKQVASYVALTPDAQIGIISDGLIYDFFILEQKTIKDKRFARVDFSEIIADSDISDNTLDVLINISKNSYDLENIETNAKKGMLRSELQKFISLNLESPSDDWIRFFLGQSDVKNALGIKIINENTINSYKNQVKLVFEEIISQRIRKVLTSASNTLSEEQKNKEEEIDNDDGLVFSEKEARLYTCIKLWLEPPLYNKYGKEKAQTILNNVSYKDSKSVFTIYYKKVQNGEIIRYEDKKDKLEIKSMNKESMICPPEEFYSILDDVIKSLEIRIAELG